MAPIIKELIDNAPWREAVTYRETWPHEYVLAEKDGQGELLKVICERFRDRRRRDLPLFRYEKPIPLYRRIQILADDPLGCHRARCRLRD